MVSGKPPFLDNITALPLEPASNDDLPKGSSQVDGTTVIDDELYIFNTSSCLIHPVKINLLCLKLNFSLGSSPIAIDFHDLYLLSILMIS